SAIEDVTMVGYPNGLWNEANNLPLFRRGITASHPGFDFNDTNIGVVDMACFPGSSGSPIFILNENGYTDKTGTHLGNSRLIFLGILFSGPTMSIDGTLIEKTIETKQNIIPRSFNMINLGYYIKAHELFSFINIIEKDLKN
ncbi:MAG: serine protease, partial [Clostridium sp.]